MAITAAAGKAASRHAPSGGPRALAIECGGRRVELIREIKPMSVKARVSQDPQRLALLLWSGLHGVISLRINKPTLDWPSATELAEQITRTIIQPKLSARTA